MTFDGAGNLYVADQGGEFTAGAVDKVAPDGTVSNFSSGIANPLDLALDAAGKLYVSDDAGTVDTVTPGA